MNTSQRFVLFMMSVVSASCGGTTDEASVGLDQPLHRTESAVGLSLAFSNGAAEPLELLGDAPRYLQEIDLRESVASVTDQGIQPLLADSRVAALDWRGVERVEELWIPGLDGKFTRERYYRGARWMNKPATFRVVGLDTHGHELGPALVAHAGTDDRLRASDDGFTRRFSARQLATGCRAIGDCAGASFVAEALIQYRDALHPESDARTLPRAARSLRLSFNQLPTEPYEVPFHWLAPGARAFGYGFSVGLEPAASPANGAYYLPGESATFRVTFRDGQGQRLHPVGELPSYADVLTKQDPSGLRYLNLQLPSRLYYALKHRESNLLLVLSGPTNRLTTPVTVVDPNLFFAPQVPFATRANDGFSAVGQTIPPAAVIFGGLVNPAAWAAPVSDLVTLTIPSDAEPGTYVTAIKARREFAGEALNRGASLEVQVGQAQRSSFTAKTQCAPCHTKERTDFGTVLHGIADRRTCFGCHASLGIEFDNALDIRVHEIHDRSNRFPGRIEQCGTCHLGSPQGPARGVLPH